MAHYQLRKTRDASSIRGICRECASRYLIIVRWPPRPHGRASIDSVPVRLAPGDHVRLRLHYLLRHRRLARRRVRRARAGSLIGILNITALGGTLLIAFAGDRIGSRRSYLVGGLSLVLVGLLLAILVPAAGIAAAILMGFGIGCGFSLSMALPVDVAHDGASVAATTRLMLLVAYTVAAPRPSGSARSAT
jgi:MFS family permease